MKVFDNSGGELLEMTAEVDPKSNSVMPTLAVGDVIARGPEMEMRIAKDAESGGLAFDVALPGLTGMRILVGKEDIKQLRGLMNKDVLGFMVRSFM